MKKSINLTLILILVSHFTFAQFGEIRGAVKDQTTGSPLWGATVVYYISGNMHGTTTDSTGEYKIKPLVPGVYDLTFSFVTYNQQKINTIKVSADKTTYLNVDLVSDLTLPPFEIIWEPPMVDAGITPTMVVLDADEIEHSVTRDVVDMVANTTGVYQKEEGGSINVRGARENSTIYVVDGIRMFGEFSLPRNAIEEITVITGGIPAQFGDATGGVVLITTKSYRNKRN